MISNLLGLEDNLELEDEEAFVDVKLELAKTTIQYLVDSPAPTGLLLVDAFTRFNPEFPWQVAFQMMATRNSEAIQPVDVQEHWLHTPAYPASKASADN